jgi:hypothetical protein
MRLIAACILAVMAISMVRPAHAQTATSASPQGLIESQPAPVQPGGAAQPTPPKTSGVVVTAPVATPNSNGAYQTFEGQAMTGKDAVAAPSGTTNGP